jgi:sigma-B regulation protein RsbU (phosphoserine phosphatase)
VGPVLYAWKTEPAFGHQVGGDGLFLEENRQDGDFLFLLVDVMGHGPAAHAGIRLLDASLANSQTWDLSPAELLQCLHAMLQPRWAATGQFVAAVALLVRAPLDHFLASQAGMPNFWQRPVGWVAWGGVPRGRPLGLPYPELYNDASIGFRPGEVLLVWSDGVTEATNAAGQQLSEGHLAHFLAGLSATASPQQMVDALFGELSTFTGAGWRQDDTTALCLSHPP